MKEKSHHNAIVLPSAGTCVCDIWSDVVIELYKKYNIHTKYFMYFDRKKLEENTKNIHEVLGNDVYYHDHLLAWKGIGFYQAAKKNVLGQQLLDSIAKYELIAIKMMDRIDPLGNSFPFSERQHFFRDLLIKWMDIIDELSIDIVFSPDVPHRVYDYALYVALKIKDKKLLTFEKTPFRDASIIIDEIDCFPDRYRNLENTGLIKKEYLIDSKLTAIRKSPDEYKLDYMERQKKRASITMMDELIDYIRNKPAILLKIALKRNKLKSRKVNKSFLALQSGRFPAHSWYRMNCYYWVKKDRLPEESWWTKTEKKNMDKKRKRMVRSFEKKYRELIDFKVDLSELRYVAVALHYQPELTTCPTGGVYVDQLLIIEMLDKILPDDIKIVVKEHSSQFYDFTESASGRSVLFYKRLKKISTRIKFIDPEISSFDVIDNSLAIATVSGTIGLEALARGKPVFVFGRTWYEFAPGAFRVKNANDLTYAYNTIINENLVFTTNEFDSYVKKLSNYFVYGAHTGSYILRTKKSRQETVRNIVAGLSIYLESMK